MKLFKYVAPERVDVLEAGLVRFTPPDALNDPFELKPVFDGLVRQEVGDEMLQESLDKELASGSSQMPPQLKRLVYGMANAYRPEANRLLEKMVEAAMPVIREKLFNLLGTKLGILSLTEDPCNMAMWAHYAAEGRGFLLEFDSNNNFFHQRLGPNDDFREVRRVTYRNRLPKLLSELDAVAVLYSKTPEWEYEKEWRMVLPLDQYTHKLNEEVRLFAFPADCLTGIVLGANIKGNVRDRACETVKSKYPAATVSMIVLNPVSGPAVCPLGTTLSA
jgi:hypothetical protein